MTRFVWMLLATLTLAACRRNEADGEPAIPTDVTVKVTRARLVDVDTSVTAPATIFPKEQANISSSITAPIRVLHARKGDVVTKGQILAQLEDRDLVAQRGEAVAAVNQARVLRERRAELFAQGAIPQRDLLATQTDLAQSQARLERIEALTRFTVLRSPFSGTIVEQFLHVGDMVKPDTPVFTVVDLSVAVARAQVPESDVVNVQLGQPAAFIPQDGSTSFAGQITMINQAVDVTRRTVEVWCELPNSKSQLRSGAFGKLRIATAKGRMRVLVPRAAVQLQQGSQSGTLVVVDAQSHAHIRAVATAGEVGGMIVIANGVEEGELVVVVGGYGLPDNSLVHVAESPDLPNKDSAP